MKCIGDVCIPRTPSLLVPVSQNHYQQCSHAGNQEIYRDFDKLDYRNRRPQLTKVIPSGAEHIALILYNLHHSYSSLEWLFQSQSCQFCIFIRTKSVFKKSEVTFSVSVLLIDYLWFHSILRDHSNVLWRYNHQRALLSWESTCEGCK